MIVPSLAGAHDLGSNLYLLEKVNSSVLLVNISDFPQTANFYYSSDSYNDETRQNNHRLKHVCPHHCSQATLENKQFRYHLDPIYPLEYFLGGVRMHFAEFGFRCFSQLMTVSIFEPFQSSTL